MGAGENGELVSDRARCLVVDQRPVVRRGVRDVLQDRYEVEEAPHPAGAVDLVTDDAHIDVVIVEMRRPSVDTEVLSGPATIRALRNAQPALGIVAHGDRPERDVAAEAVAAGAGAYVIKTSATDQLAVAVAAVLESKTFIDPAVVPPRRGTPRSITKRQRQILQLMADGQSTARIARRLELSSETVKTHTKHLLARLNARDRAHAVAIAMRNSLIE